MESFYKRSGIHDSLPLADTKRQIRLLHVLENSEVSEIEPFNLEVYNIDNAPEFDAISYTWGEAGGTSLVMVNGTSVEVRESCRYALWQAQNFGSKYIWIDSVCIDQHNPTEKGAQVSLMYEIYSMAQRVLACVGGEIESSNRFAATLPEIKAIVAKYRPDFDGNEWTGVKSHIWDNWMNQDEQSRGTNRVCVWQKWADEKSVRFNTDLCHDYRDFTDRPYFHRLWIVQELYAGGTYVHFLVGQDAISLELLRSMHSAAYAAHLAPSFASYPPKFPILDVIIALKGISADSSLAHLQKTQHLGCHDPRDRVYGTLALHRQHEDYSLEAMVPNYDKSPVEVAVEYAQRNPIERLSFDDLVQLVRALEIRLQDPQLAYLLVHNESISAPAQFYVRRWWENMQLECTLDTIELAGLQTSVISADPIWTLCRQIADEKLVRMASSTTRRGVHCTYLVPRTAQNGDIVTTSRTDTYSIGFVARIIPRTEEIRVIGLAIDLVLNPWAATEEGALTFDLDEEFMVEFEASIAEMMVLFIPTGKYPQHARLAFRPPKVTLLVSRRQHEGLYEYGRRYSVKG